MTRQLLENAMADLSHAENVYFNARRANFKAHVDWDCAKGKDAVEAASKKWAETAHALGRAISALDDANMQFRMAYAEYVKERNA